MRRVVPFGGLCALAVLLGCVGNSTGAPPDQPKPADPKAEPAPPAWSADMQKVADGHNRFAIDLYLKLAADKEQQGKNVFYSPYSVHTALGMTASGAKGTTRDQMTKVLHLPDDKVLVSGDIGRFYDHPRKAFELSVANALWGLKGFPWRAEWLRDQKDRFGAGFNEADFTGKPDAERQRINKWVEEKTREKIKDLLLPGQINGNTKMVLTNAIYFKGTWVTAFDKKKTAKVAFQCDDDTTVDVQLMYTNTKCGYAQVDGVTMVELPYKGGELSMVVVLPKRTDALADLEKKLTPELIAKWFGELKDRGAQEVSLPKFKVETRYELPEHLKALGMKDAFGPGADFTGMAASSPGWITAVTHKAFVDVNEEGTDAAAATAVGISVTSAPVIPTMRVDRPFVFLIRERLSGTILFLGKIARIPS